MLASDVPLSRRGFWDLTAPLQMSSHSFCVVIRRTFAKLLLKFAQSPSDRMLFRITKNSLQSALFLDSSSPPASIASALIEHVLTTNSANVAEQGSANSEASFWLPSLPGLSSKSWLPKEPKCWICSASSHIGEQPEFLGHSGVLEFVSHEFLCFGSRDSGASPTSTPA